MIRQVLTAAITVAMLATPAWAKDWWMPSPISVAITVGQWMMQDRIQVYYLQVRARGSDQQQARDQAFRLAVEQALGTLLVNEVVVRNDQVVRNDIINYSAGYVHNFSILQSSAVENGVEIVIDVWVKRSGIEDRLLGTSRNSSEISIDQTMAQHTTILRERAQGDRLLQTVLADFPSRAFLIRINEIRTRLSDTRQILFEIDTHLSWNTKYLASLTQAIDATATQMNVAGCFNTADSCGHTHLVRIKYRSEGDFFVKGTDSAFDDAPRGRLLQTAFAETNPHISLRIHDGYGRDVIKTCLAHHELTRTNYFPARRFVHWDERRTIVDGRLITRPFITVEIPNTDIQHARKVELAVVSQETCRSR